MTTNRTKSKKDLSVIEAARQNVLATFPLKNISDKLPLAASGSFSSPLAGSSSPVKVPSKKHTQVSPSVVSTTSKSPKIFNNRPVNKLVFLVLTTSTTTSTTTTSQITAKVKNSKKQQQAVATAMITPNPFVVPDKIFSKISTAATSPLPNMDGNSSGTSPKMGQDQLLAVLSDVVLSSRLLPIPVAKQFINLDDLKNWADQMEMESTRFSGWVVSNLVPGATFKIKIALLSSLFQLLPGCIGLKSSLNDATKVVISDKIFLTTLKIAQSSGVASVSSFSLSVVLHNVPLGIFSDDIKTTFGIFGVVTSVKKDSVRILPIANQKEVIFTRDAFKAKLVNLPFGCTAFEISNLVFQVGGCTCFIPRSSKSYQFVTSGGKLLGVAAAIGAAAFVVPPGAAAADMELNLGGSPNTTTPVLPAVLSVPNTAVESRLASLKSHLSELSVLIKSLVESVNALVVLVTKLLSTSFAVDVSVKECVNGLVKQNKDLAAVVTVMQKRLTHLETISEQICLENGSDVDDMVDNVNEDDDEDKDFLVYNNIFDVMMYLWEDQSSRIKSNPDQTAK
ncbi:hypothetical protein G9A89_008517 [Geosiphon pyriformis]|nr:hypothetical protein G9A89_008517 [Geosiphon pyriformis]